MVKVLIVDDAAFLRMRLRKLLEAAGYQVSDAADGVKALEIYKAQTPDLVLMDVNMPNMSGLEALQEIIKIDKNAKVVMLSNASQQEHILKALECGAKNFVVKPFDETRMLEQIKKMFER